ncbi:hypothetical protein [Microbacterium sp. Bi121]|uniref:hypothetical protein n=1 Tax=Microbacterium sp. Bi121 TaxID=2822348 RepID=UPI001D7BEA93|nr:hypothetical protein [Microbacterium sp. Bi121]CAH0123310.1 hypothetical protein SRABI121_00489 [Microbacterium sp. Bi121]
MTEEVPASAGRLQQVPLHSLRLDRENPRIPEKNRSDRLEDLAVILEMGFDAHPVAQSIAELGFFQAEPLIVIPSDSESGAWIVVEGNRRLTALLGLANAEMRAEFPDPEKWEALAAKRVISVDMLIPVVVHKTRETTHSEIARVHIVGKLQWRPLMQARYIAARVAEGRTLQEVADLIGIPKSKAADLYRDQAVLLQAEELGLSTSQAEAAFSLLTVALSSTKIREHVGAPLGSRLDPNQPPIPAEKTSELAEVLQWVFGDEEHEPVISDSRQMSQLGSVVSSDVGLAALRNGETLEQAKQKVSAAGLDPLEALKRRLTTAKNALASASSDLSEFTNDPEVVNLVNDIESAVEGIRSTLDELATSTYSEGHQSARR